MNGLDPEVFLNVLVLSIAIALYYTDRRSATTRALVTAFAMLATNGFGANVNRLLGTWGPGQYWAGWLDPADLAPAAVAEWLVLVMRTSATRGRLTQVAEVMLRIAQVSTVAGVFIRAGLIETVYPALISHPAPEAVARLAPLVTIHKAAGIVPPLLMALPMLVVLVRRPDVQERARVMGILAAIPVMVGAELVGALYADSMLWVLLRVCGYSIALIGIINYHVTQGQRAQFLARFLSPTVGELVRAEGLPRALQKTQLEISVVCCDLRGFTAYSESQPSERVAAVLEDYYRVVSEAAARYGGTIKDFAGDGVLVLVGAPLPMEAHARCALDLAQGIRVAVRESIVRWNGPDATLGCGVGVASGKVTVGAIDAASQLEYMAVGSAVNLAARLCSRAADGEVLVSARTAEGARASLLPRDAVKMKGFEEPVAHYALAAG